MSAYWLTVPVLVGFASNSLLCRYALGEDRLDPASFTTVRILAGALMLMALSRRATERSTKESRGEKSWLSAMALFAYAACFSLAYVEVAAGTGALLLFATVQLTMIAGGVQMGERYTPAQYAGMLLAVSGVAYLLAPGLETPPARGALLIVVAGVAWGLYSLRGRRTGDPLRATAHHFLAAVPMTLAMSLVAARDFRVSAEGLFLAAGSGAVGSGLVYAMWNAALPRLSATTAAVAQLAVPVLAAAGGVALLGESLTARLGISALLLLVGIGWTMIAGRARPIQREAAAEARRGGREKPWTPLAAIRASIHRKPRRSPAGC